MRKTVWVVMGVLLLAAGAAWAADPPRVGPPPLRNEARTLQPGPDHVWIGGYWKWAGINYEWVEGRWVKGKKDKIWVAGAWEQVGGHWAWKPGKWAKPEKPKPEKAQPEPGKPKKPDKAK